MRSKELSVKFRKNASVGSKKLVWGFKEVSKRIFNLQQRVDVLTFNTTANMQYSTVKHGRGSGMVW